MAEALTDQLNDAQTHLTEVILTALYVADSVISVHKVLNAGKRRNVLRRTITTISPTAESQKLV